MKMNFTQGLAMVERTEHWLTNEKEHPYHIFISKPESAPPLSGFPVIYVLDGNAFFTTIREQVRIQSRRSDKTGIHPAIVVGIGYPVKEDFVANRRFFDFTPPSNAKLPPKPTGGKWPETGGSEEFFTFIESELKPFIKEHFEIDESKQTLFGHSLGGLFTLEVLFSHPTAYQTYIASSPSIWWNNQSILTKENAFLAMLASLDESVGLFLSVGSLEKDHMVKDARELFNRLTLLKYSNLRVEFNEAVNENHLSVVTTTLSSALRFIGGNDR